MELSEETNNFLKVVINGYKQAIRDIKAGQSRDVVLARMEETLAVLEEVVDLS